MWAPLPGRLNGECYMPRGWEVHGNLLRVYFYYKGKRCREPLGLPPTNENKRYAEGLVSTIRHEIRAGSFDYSHRFPDSSKLQENALGHWLDLILQVKARSVAPSTIAGYRRHVENHIRPKWGNRQADKIDSIHVEDWIAAELSSLSNKTIKEIVSLLNQTYSLYRKRNKVAFNPVEGVKVSLPDDDDPDPFTRDEINAIISTPTHRLGDINMAEVAIWTGPRPSEILALGWDDVDLENATAFMRRAVVLKGYKATKTKRSKRQVDLLSPALAALKRQHKITGELPPIEISVLQRDNRTLRKEMFRPVFINQRTGEPYLDVKRYRQSFWQRHLKKAEVRYRGFSNCRHTFASQALTAELETSWIIDQLGHTTEAMIRRKYSKFIREDQRHSRADAANRALGLS